MPINTAHNTGLTMEEQITMERTSNNEEGIQKYSKEEKKRERKQKINTFFRRLWGVICNIMFGVAIAAVAFLLFFFFVWCYQDSNREAVCVEHQCIVNKSEMIYIPAYTEGGEEHPAKMVNYVEAAQIDDSTTIKWNPTYLNEFMQEGDTMTVYTYHSARMNLESKKIRYRWDGELYE